MLRGQADNNSTYTSVSHNAYSYDHRVARSLETAIPFAIASCTLSLFGGLSNLALMVVLQMYVQNSQKNHLYMFSLFASDFFYNFFFAPQVVYQRFPSTTPTQAEIRFLYSSSITFLLTGISSLFLATLYKYIFIRYPFFYASHVSLSNKIFVVAFTWLFGVFCGILRGVFNFPLDVMVGVMTSVLISTIALQVSIFTFARKQEKRIQQVNLALQHNSYNRNADRRLRATSIPNKAIKTIGLMLAVYLFSWLPSTLYRLQYLAFGGNTRSYITNIKWINLFVQIHSCINPIIFVFRTKDVRVGVETMTRKFGLNRIVPLSSDRGERGATGKASNHFVRGGGGRIGENNETTAYTRSSNLSSKNIIIPKIKVVDQASNDDKTGINVSKSDITNENDGKKDQIDKSTRNENKDELKALTLPPLSLV